MKYVILKKIIFIILFLRVFVLQASENSCLFSSYVEIKDWQINSMLIFSKLSIISVYPNWTKTIKFSQAQFSSISISTREAQYTGIIRFPDKDSRLLKFSVSFELNKNSNSINLQFKGRSENKDINIEGIYLKITLPVNIYAGGAAILNKQDKVITDTNLKKIFPYDKNEASYIYGANYIDKLEIDDPISSRIFFLTTQTPYYMQVQDERKWNLPYFTVLCRIHDGTIYKNKEINFKSTLSANTVKCQEAVLSSNIHNINIKKYFSKGKSPLIYNNMLIGFGGNYCFGENSKDTNITLSEIRSNMFRVNAPLQIWEPVNDNNNPYKIELAKYNTSNKHILKELRFVQRLKKINNKAAVFISVWDIPEWLYIKSDKANTSRQIINRTLIPELCECVTSYLLHLKQKYGIEADYFSFNEPDLGINTYFPPKIYAETVLQLIKTFKRYRLKTKIILGDVAHPRGTWNYLKYTLQSNYIIKNAGGLAFHSWGGASPLQYEHWRGLAEKYSLPLFVTEVGYDPNAWKYNTFKSWNYALQELKIYFNILKYAKPQGLMVWELTSNYSMFNLSRNKTQKDSIKPTARFFFYKQLTNLTPTMSAYTDAHLTSNHNSIMLCAMRNISSNSSGTIHIFNNAETQYLKILNIAGLISAKNLKRLTTTMYVSSWNMHIEKKYDYIYIDNNSLLLRLYPWSLTTLSIKKNF